MAGDGKHGWTTGDKGTILLTSDGGETWSRPANSIPTEEELRSITIAADGRHGYAVGKMGLILQTEDGGQRWVHVTALPTEEDLFSVTVVMPDGLNACAVGEKGIIRLTKDGGRTWTPPKKEPPVAENLYDVRFSKDGKVGWAVGEKRIILLSRDGGLTWSRSESEVPWFGAFDSGSFYSVFFAADGQHGWVAGEEGTILRTINGGETWSSPTKKIPTSDDIFSVVFGTDCLHGWAVGSGGTILLTKDGGGTWELPKVAESTYFSLHSAAFSTDGNSGSAVGESGTILFTKDAGRTWIPAATPETNEDLSSVAVSQDGQNGCTVGGNSTILFTRNGGQSWFPPSTKLPKGLNLHSVCMCASGKHGWAISGDGVILVTNDAGQTWSSAPAKPPEGYNYQSIAFLDDGSSGSVVGANGSIFSTKDGGHSWIPPKLVPTTKNLNSVAFAADRLHGWAVGLDGTILLTKDGGEMWTFPTTPVPTSDNLVSVTFAPDCERGWAVGRGGTLLRTSDGGENWFPISLNMQGRGATCIVFDSNAENGWLVGDHGMILRTIIPSLPPQSIRFGIIRSDGEPAILKPQVDVPNKAPNDVDAVVTVVGDQRVSRDPAFYRRSFKLTKANTIEPWLISDFNPEQLYTFKVQVCDGWDIEAASTSIKTGIATWKKIRDVMGWEYPPTPDKLIKAIEANTFVVVITYAVMLFATYVFWPARFAAWHEWIANSDIPGNAFVAKVLAPFLLDTSHCIDAVVRKHLAHARRLYENGKEVKLRPSWVATSVIFGDELVQSFERPIGLAENKPYIAGLYQLRSRLATDDSRWITSIEGPGGVGKSALAFQIGRWASDERRMFRLAPHPMLPLLIESPGSSIDEAAKAMLELVLDVPKLSEPLTRSLLRRKRVIVIADGVSEMPEEVMQKAIRPDDGAADTKALVVTSRRPTSLPSALVLRPQNLTLGFFDRILDDFIAVTLGAGQLQSEQRELLRNRLKEMMDNSSDAVQPQLPMIFLKLMLDRVAELLKENKPLDELPRTLTELINLYVEDLLRDQDDLSSVIQQVRSAAKVYLGEELKPIARPEILYVKSGILREQLDRFTDAGLLVAVGEKSDRFYKFALDPVAEQLNASRLIIQVRDGSSPDAEITVLLQRWSELPEDFLDALRRVGLAARSQIEMKAPELMKKLREAKIRFEPPDHRPIID